MKRKGSDTDFARYRSPSTTLTLLIVFNGRGDLLRIARSLFITFMLFPIPARNQTFAKPFSRDRPAFEYKFPRVRPAPSRFDIVKLEDHVEAYEYVMLSRITSSRYEGIGRGNVKWVFPRSGKLSSSEVVWISPFDVDAFRSSMLISLRRRLRSTSLQLPESLKRNGRGIYAEAYRDVQYLYIHISPMKYKTALARNIEAVKPLQQRTSSLS